ncbi:metalloregulator ArsR/SmtB family transcription factor [Bacillus shivajii]|uniref:ArsR/SmtB family transcription factor n=1 Tax=Bacillus shivajii TaxID=1983719 RepID=UPI001CFBD4FA|nr:metalloregulator ArsR/SmtB family transcription factor [Bacillus shivajii]UCZ52044.1 metalloregulator ArsR/SmtB family transcription factor [Bacillus shivajii]
MKKEKLDYGEASTVLKLMSDKTRLTMMALLHIEELCVCEFVEIFQTSQPSVSQHLRKLRDQGLVREKRKGQWVFYSINKNHSSFKLVDAIISEVTDAQTLLDELQKSGKRVCC